MFRVLYYRTDDLRAMRLTATNSDYPTIISFKSALLNNSRSFALLLSAEFILPSL